MFHIPTWFELFASLKSDEQTEIYRYFLLNRFFTPRCELCMISRHPHRWGLDYKADKPEDRKLLKQIELYWCALLNSTLFHTSLYQNFFQITNIVKHFSVQKSESSAWMSTGAFPLAHNLVILIHHSNIWSHLVPFWPNFLGWSLHILFSIFISERWSQIFSCYRIRTRIYTFCIFYRHRKRLRWFIQTHISPIALHTAKSSHHLDVLMSFACQSTVVEHRVQIWSYCEKWTADSPNDD